MFAVNLLILITFSCMAVAHSTTYSCNLVLIRDQNGNYRCEHRDQPGQDSTRTPHSQRYLAIQTVPYNESSMFVGDYGKRTLTTANFYPEAFMTSFSLQCIEYDGTAGQVAWSNRVLYENKNPSSPTLPGRDIDITPDLGRNRTFSDGERLHLTCYYRPRSNMPLEWILVAGHKESVLSQTSELNLTLNSSFHEKKMKCKSKYDHSETRTTQLIYLPGNSTATLVRPDGELAYIAVPMSVLLVLLLVFMFIYIRKKMNKSKNVHETINNVTSRSQSGCFTNGGCTESQLVTARAEDLGCYEVLKLPIPEYGLVGNNSSENAEQSNAPEYHYPILDTIQGIKKTAEYANTNVNREKMNTAVYANTDNITEQINSAEYVDNKKTEEIKTPDYAVVDTTKKTNKKKLKTLVYANTDRNIEQVKTPGYAYTNQVAEVNNTGKYANNNQNTELLKTPVYVNNTDQMKILNHGLGFDKNIKKNANTNSETAEYVDLKTEYNNMNTSEYTAVNTNKKIGQIKTPDYANTNWNIEQSMDRAVYANSELPTEHMSPAEYATVDTNKKVQQIPDYASVDITKKRKNVKNPDYANT